MDPGIGSAGGFRMMLQDNSGKGYRDLQGGKAPAAAFASFMRTATASR